MPFDKQAQGVLGGYKEEPKLSRQDKKRARLESTKEKQQEERKTALGFMYEAPPGLLPNQVRRSRRRRACDGSIGKMIWRGRMTNPSA